jgi:hypothetical protein
MSANGYNAAMTGPASGYTASLAGPVSAAATQGYTAAQLGQAQGYTAASGTANQQNRSNIQNVGLQSTASQLPSYLQAFDPTYQTNVINASMNDLDRARQLTQQSNAAQAAQAGAFGDSRQGVMDAQTNDAYLRNVANMSANLRQQGFNTGLQALQGDQATTLQSQLANQQADIGVSANNAGYQNQFGLANLNAQNAAAQYGAGAQNQFAQLNQAATNQAGQFQADAANQAAMQAAGLQASTNLANAASQNAAGQFNAGQSNQFGLANQAAQNAAGQFNSNLGFNVAQNNQNATNQANQYNAGNIQQGNLANQAAAQNAANLRLNAANSLVQTGQQQQNMALNNYNLLSNIGQQQQNQNQNVLNTNYNNSLAQNNADVTRAGMAQNVLSNTPYGTTTNTSQTGTSSGTQTGTSTGNYNPSIASDIGQSLKLISDKRLKTNIRPLSGDDEESEDVPDSEDSEDVPDLPKGLGGPVGESGNADLRSLGMQQRGSGPAPAVNMGFGQQLLNRLQSQDVSNSSGKSDSGGGGTNLLGLASLIPGLAFLSDIRLKTDVKPMTGMKPHVSIPVMRRTMIGRPVALRTPVGPAVATPVVRSTSLGLPSVSKPAVANPMKAVHKLKPVTFRWKGTGEPDSGFLAQNVAAAHPAAAREMGGGVKGYSLPAVVGLLADGLKQVDRKVNAKRGPMA